MNQFGDDNMKEYNITLISSKSVYFFVECMKLIQHLSLNNILAFDILEISESVIKIHNCRNIKHPTVISNLLTNLLNLNEKKLIRHITRKKNTNVGYLFFEEALIEKGYVEYNWENTPILIDLMKSNDFYYNIYHPTKIKYKIESKIQQLIQFNKTSFSSTSFKNQYCDYDVEFLSDYMVRMTFLEEIYIFSFYTTDKSLFYLCNCFKYIPYLKKFWIDMKNLTDEGISYLCNNLTDITELKSLSLFSNKITEDGCNNIIDNLHILSYLEELVIVTNQIPLRNNINKRAKENSQNKDIHLYIHTVREDI